MIQNEILGYPIFSQTIKAILANVVSPTAMKPGIVS